MFFGYCDFYVIMKRKLINFNESSKFLNTNRQKYALEDAVISGKMFFFQISCEKPCSVSWVGGKLYFGNILRSFGYYRIVILMYGADSILQNDQHIFCFQGLIMTGFQTRIIDSFFKIRSHYHTIDCWQVHVKDVHAFFFVFFMRVTI